MRARSVLAVLVCAALPGLASPVAQASVRTEPASRQAAAAAKVSVPDEVVEGDRYEVRIKVKGASNYQRADIQQRIRNIYGDTEWDSVKSLAVRNRRTLTYKAVAGEADRETFRVVLTRRSGKPVKSKAVSVKVWHWYPVTAFDAYYSTQFVSVNPYNQFAMAGRSFAGSWFTYGTPRSWETRFTLGRHCREMSGIYGITDSSSDGATASIQVLADDATTIYTSATLTPGAIIQAAVPIALPYRISIIGTNLSPEKVFAYPAVGDLRFLCSGVA